MVDYSGLENRRTATFRGFESLPLRLKEQSDNGCSFFLFMATNFFLNTFVVLFCDIKECNL